MFSFYLLMKLHILFSLLFSSGIVLLIIWAAKNLPAKDLKKYGMWFVIIGIVGAVALGTHGGKYKRHGMMKSDMYNQIMMEALSERGLEMTEEEMATMMEEVKSKKMDLFKERK